MNARQARFCHEYVYGPEAGNAAAAAAAAGYERRVQPSRLLANVSIASEVAHLTAERDAAIKATGIAERQYRLDAGSRRHALLGEIIAARADDPTMQLVAGGRTGLLVRTTKIAGNGETVDEYPVDTGLLRELRELEKQVAQDAGQWTEKREHTGKDGEPVVFTIHLGERDLDDSH